MDGTTSDLFEGAGREMLGRIMGATIRIKPSNLEKYVVFVQNTELIANRLAFARFLYQVEDRGR